MRVGRPTEQGFSLIELLIVVAMLGILAGVLTLSVTRFLGHGKEEVRKTEFRNVATAISAMTVHNGIITIPNPVTENTAPCTVGTKDMTAFPDTISGKGKGKGDKEIDPDGIPYRYTGAPSLQDKPGYLLYGHDIYGGDGPVSLLNYLFSDTTISCYTVEGNGTVRQYLEDGTEQTD